MLPWGLDTTTISVVVPPLQATVWETLEVHPRLLEKPESARRVVFLAPYGGTMLIGYGDWSINTGPVWVCGYDLVTGAPTSIFGPCPTEAFIRARVIGGKAYLPWTDPTNGNQGGYATDESGTWANISIGPNTSMIHTFDIIGFAGNLYACGSTSSPPAGVGVVWGKTPGGAWSEVLRGSNIADFARFYRFDISGGRLRVQNSNPTLETWGTTDGTTWTQDVGYPSFSPEPEGEQPPLELMGPHGISQVWAQALFSGWAWVGGPGGVVKRALVL